MGRICVTGYNAQPVYQAANKLRAVEAFFPRLPDNPAEFETELLEDSDICIVCEPMRIPALQDTMTARGFFERIKNTGATTVFTAARPEGEQPNWMMYLGMVLPYVDVFFAPYNEALGMLEADLYASRKDGYDPALCDQMAVSLLNMGCALVIFDLGKEGYYLRSNSVRPRLQSMGQCSPKDVDAWWARELYTPRFESDQFHFLCSAAGLLTGLVQRFSPEQLLSFVAGVGCAGTDAEWRYISAKISGNWPKYKPAAEYANWKKDSDCYLGPNDKTEA